MNTVKTNLIMSAALLISVAAAAQTPNAGGKPPVLTLTVPAQPFPAEHAAIDAARVKLDQDRTAFSADRKAAKTVCKTSGTACDAAKVKIEADRKTLKADQDNLKQAFEQLRAAQQAQLGQPKDKKVVTTPAGK